MRPDGPFLQDGDEVVMRDMQKAPAFPRIGFGECRGVMCLTYFWNLFVFGDLTVANEDDAMRVHGDVVLVRDQHDGVALLMQPLEQRHDFVAGGGIEVAGRLVREQNRGSIHQRARDRDTLALTTRALVRLVMHALLEID